MAARIWSDVAVLTVVAWAYGACAQDKPLELTPAGKAILQGQIAADRAALNSPSGPIKPATFPLVICAFPRGLCGAVNRDGTVAVRPQYDWVGKFADNRAAVRHGGLYGFVDEEGREIVKPQYRIVDDYKLGFAQVDVDGKSGLIDRDGKMVIEPKYGFIEAIAPDRFRVSEIRQLGGSVGDEDFSGIRTITSTASSITLALPELRDTASGVIDISGRWIEPLGAWPFRPFDKDDPSIRWVQRDKLWGLARADGSWLVEPKFAQTDSLRDGVVRVTLNGKVGFVDRTGSFAIEPTFDKGAAFEPSCLAHRRRNRICLALNRSGFGGCFAHAGLRNCSKSLCLAFCMRRAASVSLMSPAMRCRVARVRPGRKYCWGWCSDKSVSSGVW